LICFLTEKVTLQIAEEKFMLTAKMRTLKDKLAGIAKEEEKAIEPKVSKPKVSEPKKIRRKKAGKK